MPRGGWNKLPPEEKRRRNVERCRDYYYSHRKEHAKRAKEYQAKNKEEIRSQKAAYYSDNKAFYARQMREYRKRNKKAIAARQNRWTIQKRRTDPSYQLILNTRERIRYGIRKLGGVKCERTLTLLGCSIEFLREFLEAKFKPGMSWKNYGQWHIDHIIPCAAFDLTNAKDQKKCFHHTNLQPLWGVDNIAKGDIMPNGKRARFMNINRG